MRSARCHFLSALIGVNLRLITLCGLGVLAFRPVGRAYPSGRSPYGAEARPEGAKNLVEVVLLNILSVRI